MDVSRTDNVTHEDICLEDMLSYDHDHPLSMSLATTLVSDTKRSCLDGSLVAWAI